MKVMCGQNMDMYSRTRELVDNLDWSSEYIRVDYISESHFLTRCRAVILPPHLNTPIPGIKVEYCYSHTSTYSFTKSAARFRYFLYI